MAEEARLESVYTPKGYREFESRSLRIHNPDFSMRFRDFLYPAVKEIILRQKTTPETLSKVPGAVVWIEMYY